jgi:protein-S-isoprenylcysteine O-methyltransferase Ste14
LGKKASSILIKPFELNSYIGIIIFIVGLVVMLSCIARFAIEGRGTLSPADPTKRLVIHGLYKYSRNPMYLGVMLILIGESIFFNSTQLWLYSFFVFICFNLFVLLVEEPRLRRDFSSEYEEYCRKVGRWF